MRPTPIIASRRQKRKALDVVWPRDLIAKGIAHVESQSEPGHWHTVNVFKGTCTCTAGLRGFTGCKAGKCIHVITARHAWGEAIRDVLRERERARRQTLALAADHAGPLFHYERAEAGV